MSLGWLLDLVQHLHRNLKGGRQEPASRSLLRLSSLLRLTCICQVLLAVCSGRLHSGQLWSDVFNGNKVTERASESTSLGHALGIRELWDRA